PSVLRMDLVHPDVVVLRGRVQLHGHIHEAEGDGSGPDSSHAPIETQDPGTGYPLARDRRARSVWPRASVGLSGSACRGDVVDDDDDVAQARDEGAVERPGGRRE